jgi:hypothetical protein
MLLTGVRNSSPISHGALKFKYKYQVHCPTFAATPISRILLQIQAMGKQQR